MLNAAITETVEVRAGEAVLEASLSLPENCLGLVIHACGGSVNRLRPPNDYVCGVLRQACLGTLWIDLLRPDEARSHHSRNNLALLGERLLAACAWVRADARTRELPLGLFGVRQCAAAVLHAAAGEVNGLCAVVSRGGQAGLVPRLLLGRIAAPVLLVVGELDAPLVRSNRNAYAALRCDKQLEIVPGATHGFEEAGNQEVVARLARGWFLRHAGRYRPGMELARPVSLSIVRP